MVINSSQLINWILPATISLLCGAVGAYIVLRYDVKRELNKGKREHDHTHKDIVVNATKGSDRISPTNVEAGIRWARINTIMSSVLALSTIATILVLGALIITKNQAPIFPPSTIAKDALAPISVPYARVQSFDVIKDGKIIDTLNPNEKTMLSVGWNVTAKINFVSNVDLENLIFIWEFCNPGNNLIGQSAVEVPFSVSEKGQDCIQVKIMKGDEFLDTAHIFISIQ
jgi:hypothetical protein